MNIRMDLFIYGYNADKRVAVEISGYKKESAHTKCMTLLKFIRVCVKR